ncbi:MAG: hypothetical protein ABIK09_04630 [Pseudomonadota bacterium]
MKMKLLPAILNLAILPLLLLTLPTGCNTGSAVTTPGGDEVQADAGGDAAVADAPLAETSGDAGEDGIPPGDLAPVDTVPTCELGTGCFGEPCSENADCLSGWCVDHLGASVCSESCQEECPLGWSCEQVSGGGRDLVFICVSEVPSLCLPCWTGSDCAGPGDVQVPCMILEGEGSFCGGACGEDGACPAGTSCQEVATVQGATLLQCVPDSGVCECTGKAVEAGLTTPCANENDAGVCEGVRACTAGGLTSCDALEPGVETCNALDDDCDGAVDEGTCDDSNPCTDDICNGEDGCEHVALNGLECPDGDLCTSSDLCIQGICVGTPKDCDDDNPCTDEWCDAATGLCENVDNVADCDDADPCTVADECGGGACAGTPVSCDCVTDEDCDKLEDGNVCNGTLYCGTDTVPFLCKVDLDSPIDCPEAVGSAAPCLDPACDPETGACGFAEANEGFPCDDGDPCTIADGCEKGECISGIPVNCNDGNPCTDDSCVPGVGCLNTPNGAPCEDGDICTVGDTCIAGECDHGPQIACDDGNPCTDDVCDSAVGCVHTANEGPCEDGNLCTEMGVCAAGACTPGKAVTCNDEDVCTDDTCDPTAGCVHTPNTAPCNDNNACTVADICAAGLCGGGGAANCIDGNPCTSDSCDWQSGCVNEPNQQPCDDLNACTIGDICAGGACNPGAAVNCNDQNLCTTDSCVPATGCDNAPNAAPCNDGDACTTGDVCGGGLCGGVGALDCDDGNVCTDDSCDPVSGCAHAFNAAPCDDNNLCTAEDFCASGVCMPGLSGGECDDGDVCTSDSCHPTSGCLYTFNTNPCNDGSACTAADTCAAGDCHGTVEMICDDGNVCTDDSCEPLTGCVFIANDQPCNDGNLCTMGDHCGDKTCIPGTSKDCDDGDVCTTDSCQPAVGCVHALNSAPCDDGNTCTIVDLCSAGSCAGTGVLPCNDGNPCTDDSCDPVTGCQTVNNSIACDDGNTCTISDVCAGGVCTGLGSLDCDDANPCTKDICEPGGGCSHQDITGACDDGNPCTLNDTCVAGTCVSGAQQNCSDGNVCTTDSCDVTGTCQNTPNSAACADGNACTTGDHCAGGACVVTGTLGCDDGNVCTTDSCNPGSGCTHTNSTAACNDGNPCTTLDVCSGGTCVGSGSLACNDGNHCTQDDCQPGQGCVYSPMSPCCGNSVTEAGEQCDDGNTSSGDGCSSSCQIESTCGGWQWNGGCWYTGTLGYTCNQVCAPHCGFDVSGSIHSGNTVGFHFWPGKNNGSNWIPIECSSTDNNTNWGATGGSPDGNYSHSACHLNCACNC